MRTQDADTYFDVVQNPLSYTTIKVLCRAVGRPRAGPCRRIVSDAPHAQRKLAADMYATLDECVIDIIQMFKDNEKYFE